MVANTGGEEEKRLFIVSFLPAVCVFGRVCVFQMNTTTGKKAQDFFVNELLEKKSILYII